MLKSDMFSKPVVDLVLFVLLFFGFFLQFKNKNCSVNNNNNSHFNIILISIVLQEILGHFMDIHTMVISFFRIPKLYLTCFNKTFELKFKIKKM